MPTEKLVVTNEAGDELAARLDLPLGRKPSAYALFAHCFTCSKDLKSIDRINRALTRAGMGVMRFDFTGLGESEGDFSETNFSSNIDDLVMVARFMEEQYQAPSILIGHSLGGAAVLQAAHQMDTIKAVATIGAPADPEHVTHLLEDKEEEIRQRGEARVMLEGRSFKIKKQFLDDLEQTRMEEYVRTLRRALLILHSPVDNYVSIDNAERLYKAARHPKSFITLDTADHFLLDKADAQYVGQVISSWAQRYIDVEEPVEEPLMRERDVVVYTGDSYRTEVSAGDHALVADEPVAVGGSNEGPSPYQLLTAALGSCTSITLRMYADRKEWPMEGVTVALSHTKVHAKDCRACPEEDRRVDKIDRVIKLKGPLSEEQRQRLLEIADKCPVHRTLQHTVVVESSLAEPVTA